MVETTIPDSKKIDPCNTKGGTNLYNLLQACDLGFALLLLLGSLSQWLPDVIS